MVGLRPPAFSYKPAQLKRRSNVLVQASHHLRLLDLDDSMLQQHVLARLPFSALVALWHTSRACRRLISTAHLI